MYLNLFKTFLYWSVHIQIIVCINHFNKMVPILLVLGFEANLRDLLSCPAVQQFWHSNLHTAILRRCQQSDIKHNEWRGHVQCVSLSLYTISSLHFFSQLDFQSLHVKQPAK